MKKIVISAFWFIFLNNYLPHGVLAQMNKYPGPLFINVNDSTRLSNNIFVCGDNLNSLSEIKRGYNVNKNIVLAPSKLNHHRLAFASILLISLNYAVYQPFKSVWWEEERTHFHFYRGWRRNRGYCDFGWHDTLYGHIDKLGHYYCARLLSDQISTISCWIGFDEKSSQLIGPILSSVLMLEIEIYDGFFKEWGFSLADFAANEFGAFSPIVTEKFPALNHVQLKFSYHPSHQAQQESSFIKDYAGMTFWLSYNIHSLMPVKFKKFYPPWLNLSLGYGISKQTRGNVELYLAPDINWMKVPLGRSQSMLRLKKVLNYVHFPTLCLKLTPEKKFYPLYF